MGTPEQPELTSWKEIADRLQVTVRTAQEWEKQRGLPVRRLPGGGRSRVFMRVSELEAWLDGQVPEINGAAAEVGGTSGVAAGEGTRGLPLRRLVRLTGFGALVIMAAATALWLLIRPTPVPFDWRVVVDELVVLDENEDELWRHRFDASLDRAFYESRNHKVLEFAQLDDDEGLETLVVVRDEDKTLSDILVCLDDDGAELWRFVPGREVRAEDGQRFENIYKKGTFRAFQRADGSPGVIHTASHHIEYPNQVVLLSGTTGELLSEYWHSGHLGMQDQQMVITDLNDDRRPELFLAGVNNARDRATLVVFDPETMAGASDEGGRGDQLLGLPPAREIARLLFRRSAVSEYLDEFNVAHDLWITPQFITVAVTEGLHEPGRPVVIYHLLPDFSFDHLSWSSGYTPVHERLLEEGHIALDLEEQERILSGIDYVGTPRPLLPAR